MSKIFQAIDKLTLVENGPNERPSATVMNSTVGYESVTFTVPLKLVGKVESYLQEVIYTMNTSLKDIKISSFKAIE